MKTYPYEVARFVAPSGPWVTTETGKIIAEYPSDVLGKFDFEGDITNEYKEYSDGTVERTWTQRQDGYLIGRIGVLVFPPLP